MALPCTSNAQNTPATPQLPGRPTRKDDLACSEIPDPAHQATLRGTLLRYRREVLRGDPPHLVAPGIDLRYDIPFALAYHFSDMHIEAPGQRAGRDPCDGQCEKIPAILAH